MLPELLLFPSGKQNIQGENPISSVDGDHSLILVGNQLDGLDPKTVVALIPFAGAQGSPAKAIMRIGADPIH